MKPGNYFILRKFLVWHATQCLKSLSHTMLTTEHAPAYLIYTAKLYSASKLHSDIFCFTFSPILDWAFCQPGKTGGGGQNDPSPNLAVSSQITVKLGKGIPWVEIFTNWNKFLMTSSSCWFYDVIKMRQIKKWKVFESFCWTSQKQFHQTHVIFRQSPMASFEIKRLKTGHSLLPW